MYIQGYMFRAIIRPYYKNRFIHSKYNLGSQNVLGVNEPVFIVRPDDGPIEPKHVALYVLTKVIIDVLDKNINTLFKRGTHRDK
jgi:hypothetical protein